jgi:hypothetical protein
MYLIWSFEHNAWWNPAWRGYTQDVNEAGLYDKEEAEKICENANAFGSINEEMRLASDYGR